MSNFQVDPSIFERVAKRPIITSAVIQRLHGDNIEVRVNLKSSQWKDDTSVTTHCSVLLQVDSKSGRVISESSPIPFDPKVHIFTSCHGSLTINGLQLNDKPVLQVCCSETGSIRQVELKCSALYNDPYFGFTDWSADGKKFVFQGERNVNHSGVDKFLYRPSWGERLAKNYSVGLFCLDVESGQVTELATNSNPSQVFIQGDRIWYVDQHELHYGLFYCFNRPNSLKSIALDGTDEQIYTAEDEAINLPSKGNDGSIWFLSNQLGGSHHQSSTLCRLDPRTRQITRFPSPKPHGFFIALFFKSFIQCGDPIYGIDKGCQRVIVKHNGHEWTQLTHGDTTWSPIHRQGDYILALESSRTLYPRLMLFNGSHWHTIYEVPSDWSSNFDLETTIVRLSEYVEMVILKPKGKESLPCIMIPHGGPNDCFANEWSPYQWVYAQHGMACISGMNITSDIWDWGAGQMGLKYDMHHPKPITDAKLQAASPSNQVHRVSCPTLLLLGTHDLRVPSTQGIMWYRWLKGQGVPVKAYLFPEAGHALDTPEGERWTNLLTLQWFAQHQ